MGIMSKDKKTNYSTQMWKRFLEEAQERCTANDYEAYREEFLEFMREYENSHEEELGTYYTWYEEAASKNFSDSNYIFTDSNRLRMELSKCRVMIITANPIEKAIFHRMICQKTKRRIVRIFYENTTYYILKWDEYWVAHIHQTETGANKNLGTNFALNEALKYFTPNVIISLGIAFGIDYRTQKIGEVIVSKRVLPYSENKRDEDRIKPDRSQDKALDYWLQVRLVNTNGFLDGVIYGDVLTGGSVMSSFKEKDQVCAGYTNADFVVGGEMEGNALFQIAQINDIPGVIIKGICDWGIAKNDLFPCDPDKEERFKKSLQAYAMVCAIESCEPLFHDKKVFATPKNIATIQLKRKYRLVKNCFILSQLITFGCWFILLGGTELGFYFIENIIGNPVVVFKLLPIVLLILDLFAFIIWIIFKNGVLYVLERIRLAIWSNTKV